MLDKNLLLVDIGGTNIRYAYSNIGDSGFVSENKAELDSLNDFDNLMSVLLAESDVKHIVFSVAGPKVNNSIKMTNRNFEIDADEIRKKFNSTSKDIYCSHFLNEKIDTSNIEVPKIGDKKKLIELGMRNARYMLLEKRKSKKIILSELIIIVFLYNYKKILNYRAFQYILSVLITLTFRAIFL